MAIPLGFYDFMDPHSEDFVMTRFFALLVTLGFSAPSCLADDLPPSSWQLLVTGQRFVAGQAQDPSQSSQSVQIDDRVWLDAAGNYLWLTHSEWPGGIKFQYRQFGTANGGARMDVTKWRDGIWLQRSDAAKAKQDYVDQTYLLPALLQTQLRGATGQLVANSSSVERTNTGTDAAGRPVTWTYNDHGQLLSVAQPQTRYEYLDYPDANPGSQPARIWIYRGGQQIADLQVARQAAELPADFQQIPLGYVDKPTPSSAKATLLAPGVYRIDQTPSGYHTGVVIGRDGIAVFDAPIDAKEAAANKAIIRQLAPTLPIKYIVVSHSHRDHVGGLLALLDPATQVITGVGGQQALQRLFGSSMPHQVREISQQEQLSLGDRHIALWPLRSSHAHDMLVAADVTSGTVFQGDLFYLPEVGPIPPAFPLTAELVQLLNRHIPAWRQLVGVHGRTATPTDVRQSVRLRTQVDKSKP